MRTIKGIAAATTDDLLGSGVGGSTQPVARTGYKIVVKAVFLLAAATATTVTFNSKPGGAGAAISPAFANAANGGFKLEPVAEGWFETASGEGLSVTTGAGSTVAMIVIWDYVPSV